MIDVDLPASDREGYSELNNFSYRSAFGRLWLRATLKPISTWRAMISVWSSSNPWTQTNLPSKDFAEGDISMRWSSSLTCKSSQFLSPLVQVIFRSTYHPHLARGTKNTTRQWYISILSNPSELNSAFFQMTMVLDHQSRQFGGMGFENNMYPSMHAAPNFSDPWAHQTSNHAHNRPNMPMPYQQLSQPPTSAPLVSSSQYATHGVSNTLGMPQELTRPNISYPEQQQYSSPRASAQSYATSYPSMNYAQTLAQQQAQQQRRASEV